MKAGLVKVSTVGEQGFEKIGRVNNGSRAKSTRTNRISTPAALQRRRLPGIGSLIGYAINICLGCKISRIDTNLGS